MKARTLPDAITITAAFVLEGETVLETDCRDFDHWLSLPSAVEYDGVVCGKSGWSSDTNRACYKSRQAVAFARRR